MRRREKAEGPAPARLCRYLPEEWGDDPQAWYDARDAWRDENPGEHLPLDGVPPDVPWDPSAI